jgi:hypothetical protein
MITKETTRGKWIEKNYSEGNVLDYMYTKIKKLEIRIETLEVK